MLAAAAFHFSAASFKEYGHTMVGANGLEPSTSASRTLRATKLRYAPIAKPLYCKTIIL